MPLQTPAHVRFDDDGYVLADDHLFCLVHFDGMSRRLLQFYVSVSKARKLTLHLSAFAPGLPDCALNVVCEADALPAPVASFLDGLDEDALRSLQDDYCPEALRFLTDIGWQQYLFRIGEQTRTVRTNGASLSGLPASASPFEKAFFGFHEYLYHWCVRLYEERLAEAESASGT